MVGTIVVVCLFLLVFGFIGGAFPRSFGIWFLIAVLPGIAFTIFGAVKDAQQADCMGSDDCYPSLGAVAGFVAGFCWFLGAAVGGLVVSWPAVRRRERARSPHDS
jgi:hypothetical protein